MIITAMLRWIIAKGGFLWPGILLLAEGIFALAGQQELEE